MLVLLWSNEITQKWAVVMMSKIFRDVIKTAGFYITPLSINNIKTSSKLPWNPEVWTIKEIMRNKVLACPRFLIIRNEKVSFLIN